MGSSVMPSPTAVAPWFKDYTDPVTFLGDSLRFQRDTGVQVVQDDIGGAAQAAAEYFMVAKGVDPKRARAWFTDHDLVITLTLNADDKLEIAVVIAKEGSQ